MDINERYVKTQEVLLKFAKGDKLYHTSAKFNTIVQLLVNGIDPYSIIEKMVEDEMAMTKAFEQYMIRDTRPMIINNKRDETKRNK